MTDATQTRRVWLSPDELGRDAGPVDGLSAAEPGAWATHHYPMPSGRRRLVSLGLAALGAGLAIAAPVVGVVRNDALLAALMLVGAVQVTAVRLVLLARARDATIGHHGAMLARLPKLLPRAAARPDMAATRLGTALAAGQDADQFDDLLLAGILAAVVPVAAGLWLAGPARGLVAVATLSAAAFGLLVGTVLEGRNRRAVAPTAARLARADRTSATFVAAWPTMRQHGATRRAPAWLARTDPVAGQVRAARTRLDLTVAGFAVPGMIASAVLMLATGMPSGALAAMLLAALAAGQAGLTIGGLAVRRRYAAGRRRAADRLFPPARAPVGAIDRIESVAAEALGFAYPDAGAPVFGDIGFTLRRGQVLALASPSGTGKSTLVRLLAGLARPMTGRILINGRDARTLDYLSRVAVVFQDEPVGSGTIRSAIAGGAAVELDDIWDAAARVGIDAAIRGLTMEMQTLIVHGPFPLSLLQPILIARALAQRPDLLILDETLGALPLEQARVLLDDLRRHGTIVVFASHDPALVALADQVLALNTD